MNEFESRYQTQLKLPAFGDRAQHLLQQAKVLIIGAGGLGCPCIQYLVAAGVGCIGICDGDQIEKSNLQRQILFTSPDIGLLKTTVVKQRLQHVNKAQQILTFDHYIDQTSALKLFPQFNLIIDCTDDIQTRLLINDACLVLNKPLIYGAVFQYEGQVAVFNSDDQHINLHDIFNEIKPADIIDCNHSGTLGVVTGLVGTMQASEAIKYLTGMRGLLANEMLLCNFLTYDHYKINIPSSGRQAEIPVTAEDFLQMNYAQTCKYKANISHALDAASFLQKASADNVQVIDVRNAHELPEVHLFQHQRIPLAELLKHPEKVKHDQTVLLFCHAGIRSQTALDFLIEECHLTEVYHLKGGLLKLNLI